MTPTQQQDLQTFKDTGIVGDSISNLFVEDCLKELTNYKITREKFNKNFIFGYCTFYDSSCDYDPQIPNLLLYDDVKFEIYQYNTSDTFFWYELENYCQLVIIQALLSRTSDGQAAMSFLDVEINLVKKDKTINSLKAEIAKYKKENRGIDFIHTTELELRQVETEKYLLLEIFPKTLDHLLYREFTEAIRVGKTFDQALEIINKIYLNNIYV